MARAKTIQQQFRDDVRAVLDDIGQMLAAKNRRYGNSALDPLRVFSKASTLEQLRVRIDDKLSRIRNREGAEDEDVLRDLIGYLVIYRIAQRRERDGR